ncbi:MAG TPA: hypothetical protein VFV99_20560 [Kofleriaceae bacterium]|nr:hypothetical protein [Kofleriaceae bacterium]
MSLAIVIAAAACGGKKPAPATTTTEQHAEGEGHGMEHEGMPAEMTKFHDVLAPRWHAEKGPQRMKDTCAAIPEFKADADALAKATPPEKANADTWTASTKALVDSVNGLDPVCQANDAAKFEEAFHKVHESFHATMAAAGMPMEKHEGGEGGEHEHKM